MANKIADSEIFNYFKITKDLFTARPMNLSRRNYWLFWTLNFVLYVAIMFSISLLSGAASSGALTYGIYYYNGNPFVVFLALIAIAVSIYYIVIEVLSTMARLHNAGFSAAWTWLYLAPFGVGSIALLIMRCIGEADSKYIRQ